MILWNDTGECSGIAEENGFVYEKDVVSVIPSTTLGAGLKQFEKYVRMSVPTPLII